MHSLFQPSFAFGGGACNVIGERTGVFFTVCDNLFKFVKKPTVAAQYSGGMLKRLLDLWWTGHLPTGSVIVRRYGNIVNFLSVIGLQCSSREYSTDIKMEAAGLVKLVSEADFKFITVTVHRILLLFDPANKILQAEATNLYTGLKHVHSVYECIQNLRFDSEFEALWTQFNDGQPVTSSKR